MFSRRGEDRFDLVVIGLGSGGLPAARFALEMGLRVAAVERDRVGGDCLWTGCVPSKALLASAKVAHHLRHADRWGLPPRDGAFDTAAVWARVRAVQEAIATTDDSPEPLLGRGLVLHRGEPRLTGPREVTVGEHRLATRFVLLASGSRPAVPPLEGLEAAAPLTSDTVWDLERAPESLVVVGGGPIAVELAQALTRLGTRVTVLQKGPRLLAREEPSVVARLRAVLEAEGVEIVEEVTTTRVERRGPEKVVHGEHRGRAGAWSGAEVLVATGRRPNVEGLGLEELGVELSPRGVVVDERMRSSVPTVYAAGDVAGRFLFTHSATHEGIRAVRDMFFPGKGTVATQTPWCTFTDPELARVGLTEAEARDRGGDVAVFERTLGHSDRARAEGAEEGTVRIVTDGGRIVGAHILAPAAGELVAELALAMDQDLPLARLARVVHAYPTVASTVAELAAEAVYDSARRLRWLVRVPGVGRILG